MAGSAWGTVFRIAAWREPHREGIDVVIDKCPAGLELPEADIQVYLDRRKSGQSRYTTMRQEDDQAEILSGVSEGEATGAPISLLVRNQDQRSHDYSEIMDIYRPGYADYTFDEKYGSRNYRGDRRSSGRETTGRAAVGAVATKLLGSLRVQMMVHARSIGGIEVAVERFNMTEIGRNRVCMPDAKVAALTEAYLDELMEQEGSAGGVVECVVNGVPAGIGETVFNKLDAGLAQTVTSIGTVKGVGIGDEFAVAKSPSFGNNDESYAGAGGGMEKRSNRPGGILGGMSGGSRIVSRTASKPTSSIVSEQHMVDRDGENMGVAIRGRHDPIMVSRTIVVVECMAALTTLDMMLCGMTSRLDRVVKFYDRE